MNTLASDSIHTEEIILNEDGQVMGKATQRQHHQLTPAQVLSFCHTQPVLGKSMDFPGLHARS